VRSRRNTRFKEAFRLLPADVQRQAREAYRLFRNDPYHPSLHFKIIQRQASVWSVRVSRQYRALGVMKDDVIVWFWIGSHAEYDLLLARLSKR
jgi:hypothetical protein